MPRLVDYSLRLRTYAEAAGAITLRDGPLAISLRTVAQAVDHPVASVRRAVAIAGFPLPCFPLDLIGTRREARYLRRIGLHRDVVDLDATTALQALLTQLPQEPRDADDEIIWQRIVTALAVTDEPVRAFADLWNERLDQLVGRVIDTWLPAASRRPPGTGPEPRRQTEAARLRAIIDGATAAAGRRDITCEQGIAVVRRHVEELRDAAHGPTA